MGASLQLKVNEYGWGGGDTPRWDSQCGDSQPLSALLLPLLQQLDDLGDALLGDLPGTEGCQPQGTPWGVSLAGGPREGQGLTKA